MIEDEYIMDIKPEGKRAQTTNIDVMDIASDCSTLSASEVDSQIGKDSTPPLFWKLKKARVLMKKLPRDVLAKYDLSSKNISWISQPSRSSGRIKSKHIPTGKYLAIHKNKPLDKVINKEKRLREKVSKIVKYKRDNHKGFSVKNKTVMPAHNSNSSIGKSFRSTNLFSETSRIKKQVPITSLGNNSYPPQTTLRHKNEVAKDKTVYKVVATSTATTTPAGNLTNTKVFNNPLPLHERIAATRIINEPIETPLPILPDVVITRYDLPPASRNQIGNNEFNVSNTIPTSIIRNRLHSRNTTPGSFNSSYPKLHPAQNIQSKVFPTFLTPAHFPNKTHCRSLPSSILASGLNKGLGRIHQSTPKQFTIQAFKKPYEKPNLPNPVDSSKVFVVNQPSLGIDPLNMPISDSNMSNNHERPKVNEIPATNDVGISVDSDSDFEQIDAEEHIEPEVIKRIIYHEKSVQTKFTCNGSIVGLVDSDEFNLNCFYCYDIFPLHKWLEFKEHIKKVHHVEEKANLSDSDVEIDNAQAQSNNQENVLKTLPTKSRSINEIKKIACEGKLTAKPVNIAEQSNKKLPLEPKLVAQRQNKTGTEQAKFFSSTPKTASKSSKVSEKTSSELSHVEFNNSRNGGVINIDSDDGGLDLDNVNVGHKTSRRNLQADNQNTKNKTMPDGRVLKANEPKLILPSLPHITIKKVDRVLSKENTPTTSLGSSTSLTEKFIKIPSTTNIQEVIKTLPKSTANQLSENGQTKPRYFVVKKIIKLPSSDTVTDVNIPKGTVLTKMIDGEKVEDYVPKPTSGLGILFGVTNSMIVIEFLLKLKIFPELWRSQLEKIDIFKYNDSLKKLCSHLNNRFELEITEFEMRLSIQRVKDWYYLVLQTIKQHKKDSNNTESYEHRFPLYFKILSQYLTPDAIGERSHYLNQVLNKTSLATKVNKIRLNENAQVLNERNTNFLNKTSIATKINDMKLNEKAPDGNENKTKSPTTISANIPNDEPQSKNESQNVEGNLDNLIQFDADTLYNKESSDDEPFDESIFFGTNDKKKTKNQTNIKINADGTPRKPYPKVPYATFECEVCKKLFKRSCDLRRHSVLHFPPQFECKQCKRKYNYKYYAENCTHIVKGYKKKYKSSYKKVDKASGEKRIFPKKVFKFNMICEICGNSYRSIGSLNTHRRDKHFNQKFKCVVCNFTALSNWRVEKHQMKRHIVEPGLPEDVAKKSRPRTITQTKISFSNEAMQGFYWRKEMRKTLKPGEKFFGCCKCKIVFNTRSEKIFHNKNEHPITEETRICLLCWPKRLLLSNINGARIHYTNQHKVPWYEIDGLVLATKSIFSFLNNGEIELLKASENYKELLGELLKDKQIKPPEKLKVLEDGDETLNAVQNLADIKKQEDDQVVKFEVGTTQEANIYIDGILDHNQNDENVYKQSYYAIMQDHNYSEKYIMKESCDDTHGVIGHPNKSDLCDQQDCDIDIKNNDNRMQLCIQNNQEYLQNIVENFVEDELNEENIVVEECIDKIIGEDKEDFLF